MIAKILKKYFDDIIELDLGVWENFAGLGIVRLFPKETIIKHSNTTEGYFNFIVEGCGGNLIWNKNKFACTDISTQHQPICDYVSFITQKPSPIEVRLFENSKVIQIHYQSFQKIFLSGNHGEKVSRLALESAYKEKEQQQIDLLTKTAKKRYLDMILERPPLETVPLKYLASYLGITPQSLSRIRADKI